MAESLVDRQEDVSAHLMGSCSWTSRNVRPRPAEPCPSCPLLSFAPSLRSCWMSLRDSERPVPSYLHAMPAVLQMLHSSLLLMLGQGQAGIHTA